MSAFDKPGVYVYVGQPKFPLSAGLSKLGQVIEVGAFHSRAGSCWQTDEEYARFCSDMEKLNAPFRWSLFFAIFFGAMAATVLGLLVLWCQS